MARLKRDRDHFRIVHAVVGLTGRIRDGAIETRKSNMTSEPRMTAANWQDSRWRD